MLEDKKITSLNLINSYILCETSLNNLILHEIHLKNLSINTLIQSFKVKMIHFHSNQLDSFFSDIKDSIFCENCIENLSQTSENKSKCRCLFTENDQIDISEDCIDANSEEINSIFQRMIGIFIVIYDKENLFFNKFQILQSMTIFNEIKLKYIHLIKLVIKSYLKNLLLNFKQNFNFDEQNSQINKKHLNILIKLEIYDIYEETLKQIMKQEVSKKIEKFSTIHDRPILINIINIFKDLFFKWADRNLKENSNLLKEEFEVYIKNSYLKIKTDYFFDIITNYPESHPILLDLRMCLDECKTEVYKILI